MTLRLFVPGPLAPCDRFELPPGAARHAQVRRVQPGDELCLFDGSGCDFPAQVLAMGRSAVEVRIGAAQPVARELPWPVTLAVGMPANERMDTLVEKAAELGVAVLQPLLCERAVLRLAGERAEKKREHWQAIAVAACEQSGRAVVPEVRPVLALPTWLAGQTSGQRIVLSPGAPALRTVLPAPGPLVALSGPEGGLAPAELAAAQSAGFQPAGLGPRVLRADTAPLAVLSWLALGA